MAGEYVRTDAPKGSILSGAVVMVVVSVLLFFLPAINGLIGGFVGGYRVGDPWRGLAAAVLPGLFVAVALWIVLALLNLPVLGLITGAGAGILIALSEIGLFLGALLGGAAARMRRAYRHMPA